MRRAGLHHGTTERKWSAGDMRSILSLRGSHRGTAAKSPLGTHADATEVGHPNRRIPSERFGGFQLPSSLILVLMLRRACHAEANMVCLARYVVRETTKTALGSPMRSR